MGNRASADRITRRIMGQLKQRDKPDDEEYRMVHIAMRRKGWDVERDSGSWDFLGDYRGSMGLAGNWGGGDLVKEWAVYDYDADTEAFFRRLPSVIQARRKLEEKKGRH